MFNFFPHRANPPKGLTADSISGQKKEPAPLDGPGDFSEVNAECRKGWKQTGDAMIALWENEAAEARLAGKTERESECLALARQCREYYASVDRFYCRWRLRP